MTFRYDTSLSGLDLMRDLDRRVVEPDPDGMIPMFAAETRFGRTLFRARADRRHLNPFGIVHGGFACGLLDSAAGMAAHSTLPPERWIATVDLNVKFLRPVQADEELSVEGWTTHVSKQLIVADASIKDGRERLLATGAAVFIVKEIAAAP